MYESGEGEGDDSLLWARKHLFLINNLYAVELYLLDRKKEVGGSGGIGIVGGSKTDAAVGVMFLFLFLFSFLFLGVQFYSILMAIY